MIDILSSFVSLDVSISGFSVRIILNFFSAKPCPKIFDACINNGSSTFSSVSFILLYNLFAILSLKPSISKKLSTVILIILETSLYPWFIIFITLPLLNPSIPSVVKKYTIFFKRTSSLLFINLNSILFIHSI